MSISGSTNDLQAALSERSPGAYVLTLHRPGTPATATACGSDCAPISARVPTVSGSPLLKVHGR